MPPGCKPPPIPHRGRASGPGLFCSWPVALALLLAGCVASRPERFPPPAGAPTVAIRLVSHGWHTGLVLPRAALTGRLPALAGQFVQAEWLEIGWGDLGFYTAPDQQITSGLTLQALFASRGSVLHVVGLNGPPEQAFPHSDVQPIVLGEAGFAALADGIEASFAASPAVALGPGLYGDSRFYAARGHYWALHTCNTWTAERLLEAGCPVTPFWALGAGNTMWQARRHCAVNAAD